MVHSPPSPPTTNAPARGQPWLHGLSGRLLVLTAIFVLLVEIVVYLPSIARYRQDYLLERVDRAYLALQVLRSVPDFVISPRLEQDLLQSAGVEAITLRLERQVILTVTGQAPRMPEVTVDLRQDDAWRLIMDALLFLTTTQPAYIEVKNSTNRPMVDIQVVIDTEPMRAHMWDYSQRIAIISLIISLFTAALVFLTLQRMTVRPLRRLIDAMQSFRRAPESINTLMPLTQRMDEIGSAHKELRILQEELQDALRQKERLAGVGQGVAKVSHDLRNTLATAHLLGERLSSSSDPTVQEIAPRIADAVEQALKLCTETLQYGAAKENTPRIAPFRLSPLIEEVALSTGAPDRIANTVESDFLIYADREHLFRVLHNLSRNALQAMGPLGKNGGPPGQVTIDAKQSLQSVHIRVMDQGAGLPRKARDNLFKPFIGSARKGGTGLGLVICLDLVRAHGGTLNLVQTGETGTTFEITLPQAI